jgi:hypothetical protein
MMHPLDTNTIRFGCQSQLRRDTAGWIAGRGAAENSFASLVIR